MAERLTKRQIALSGMLLAIVCSNTTPIFTKVLLERGWTPVSLYFLTLLVMTIFLALHEFMQLERGKRWGMTRADFKGVLYTTFTGGVISPILFFAALESISASEAVLLSSSLPLFVVLFAVLLLQERFNAAMVGGGLLLLAGIILMQWENILQAQLSTGALLMLLSTATGALTTIWHKKLVKHRHLDSIVLTRSIISLLIIGGWMLLTEPSSFAILASPGNIWLLMGLPVIGFILPFFFYFRALRNIKAIEAGLVAGSGPIVGILLASVFLGETITHTQMMSLGLIVLGILYINVPLTRWRIVPSRLMEIGPLRK